MKFDDIRNSIETKLGEEQVSLIADDMASLITFNKNQEDTLKSRDEEIDRLKKDKEKLILANGNLLKQIPMSKDEGNFEKEEKEEKTFSFRSIFDEKGNIKKSM